MARRTSILWLLVVETGPLIEHSVGDRLSREIVLDKEYNIIDQSLYVIRMYVMLESLSN